MPTSYTSLLGLALPANGELSGTWGDTVNNYITQYLDAAVSGTQTLSADADATLTKTTGTGLTSTSSQYMILNCTGARSAARNITVPAASKTYVVINGTSGGFAVTLRGAGPTTGISIAAGEYAVCAWNGSDFVKVSSLGGSGTFSSLTLTGGSANTVPYLNGSKAFTSSANLAFDGNSFLVGNPTAFTSVTQAGVLGVGGYGVYTFLDPNGTTGSSTISSVTQNPVTFFGDNGATSQRFIGAYISQKISNSGAGGTNQLQVNGIWSVPEIVSSGATAQINIGSIQGHGSRFNAADLSSNSANIIRGALFTGRHEPTLSSTALTGTVFAAKGHGINRSGTVTTLFGLNGAISVGSGASDPVSTVTNASVFGGAEFQVGSSGVNAATVTNGYGVNIPGPDVGATGAVTNWYAFFAGTPTGAGTITNRWGVYIADSLSNNYFAGNVQIGNPAAFTSVTVPGVLGVGGYGPFQYIGTNGATVLIDTGVSFALQNSTVFSGNNGASSQRLNSIVANPRISNSGAGGSAAVLAGAITGIPLVSSSGTGGVLTVSGVIGHGARNQALDTSQATSNVIRGASLTARHDGALPSTAVSGLVHGADGFSFNQTGTVTVQSGFLVRVGVGGADTGPVANATSTTVAQFNGEVFIVGVASSAFTATVTDGYGVRLVGPEVAATGTMTNYYAVFASAPTVTGTLTNRWGVYMADSLSPNYFAGNVLVGGTSAPGQGVVYMANAAVVPASNPTGGGVLYVEGGALKYRGSSGTITTIANA